MHFEAKWQVLAVICAGIFISTLDGSILNIANPIIAHDLKVSINEVQWVTTAYMLFITATLMFFGKIGDRIGSQKVFAYGFLFFSTGSLFCSLSPALLPLVISRIFQGAGASMMMATGSGIISNVFPAEEKGRALGLTASMVGIGNMTGPVIGGIILAHYQWPAIFLVNLPIGIAGFFYALRYLPVQPIDKTSKSHDVQGIILFAVGSVMLLLSLSAQTNINIFLLIAAFLLLAGFIYWEKQINHSLLDFSLFKIKVFLYGNILSFFAYVSQIWMLFLVPFYLENFMHYSPGLIGLFMVIPPLFLAITSPVAGNLSDKIGSGILISLGLLLMTLAHTIYAWIVPLYPITGIITGLALIGIGMGLFNSPNSSSIFKSVPEEKAGYTGGFNGTIRNFALSLGIAVSASLFAIFLNLYAATPSAYPLAMSIVYKISALFTLTGFIISLFASKYQE